MFSYLIGETIDSRYLLLELIGEGGMGSVFTASEQELGRIVAIKFLQSDLLADGELKARFRREALVLSKLSHPNIVQFYRLGQLQDNQLYIAMEYVSGQSLRKLLVETSLTVDEALGLTVQICDAVEAAHRHGVLHRDLKPENILIVQTDNGLCAKLIDFGLAGEMVDSSNQHLTKTGLVLGSISYMSPEQSTGQKASPASDVYSLGCILFELVSGQLPFSADTPIALMYKHASEPPPQLSNVIPDKALPAGLSDVVLKAMDKSPDHRYTSMMNFKADLQCVIQGDSIAASEVSSKVGSERRFPGAWFFAVIALMIVAGVGTASHFVGTGTGGWQQNGETQASFTKILRKIWYTKEHMGTDEDKGSQLESLADLDRQVNNAIILQTTSHGGTQQGALCQAHLIRAIINQAMLRLSKNSQYLDQFKISCNKCLEYASSSDGKKLSPAIVAYASLAEEAECEENTVLAEELYRKSIAVKEDAAPLPPGFFLQRELPGGGDQLDVSMLIVAAESLGLHRSEGSKRRLKNAIDNSINHFGRLADRALLGAILLDTEYQKEHNWSASTELRRILERSIYDAPSVEQAYLSETRNLLLAHTLSAGQIADAARQLAKAPGNAMPDLSNQMKKAAFRSSFTENYEEATNLLSVLDEALRGFPAEQVTELRVETLRESIFLAVLNHKNEAAMETVKQLNNLSKTFTPACRLDLYSDFWVWNEATTPGTRTTAWPLILVFLKRLQTEHLTSLARFIVTFEAVKFATATAPPNKLEPYVREIAMLRNSLEYPQLKPSRNDVRYVLGQALVFSHKGREAKKLLLEFLTEVKGCGKAEVPQYPSALRYLGHLQFDEGDYSQCEITASKLENHLPENPYDKADGAYLHALSAWRLKEYDRANENFKTSLIWWHKTDKAFRGPIHEVPDRYAEFLKERNSSR